MRACTAWLLGIAGFLIVASLLFISYPIIDINTSRVFFSNGYFLFDKNGIGAIFTVYFHVGMRLVFFTFAFVGALLLVTHRQPVWLSWPRYLFIVLSVALAAGLMTNFVFKDHWGRARPAQTEEFGGAAQFSPAWIISDQCHRNCSFTGGDVSFAACSLAPALLACRRKALWVVLSLAFTAVIAFGRIAAGAHFLSDCVIAALTTVLAILLMHRLWEKRGYFP